MTLFPSLGAVGLAVLLTPLSPSFAGDTRIVINFTEAHDRLGADPQANIYRSVTIEATLTGDGHVHERSVSGVAGGRRHAGNVSESQSEEKLGDASAKVVWHVRGPKSLQRLVVGKQFLSMANVEIGADGSCALDIKFLLQRGYSEVVMRRRDNGEMANFTLPKVVSSSCAIQ